MELLPRLDETLFHLINGLAGQWGWLDSLARLLMNDYFVPTLLAIALLALWFEGASPALRDNNRRAVVAATLSAALANAILKLVNLLYFRPRPFVEQPVTLLFYRPHDSSLPSNAAALGFAIAAGVWFYNRTWGWGLLLVAGLFGLSRIYGGVHYPLDVITGTGLGWSAAWLVHRLPGLVERLVGLIVALAHKLGVS